MQEEIKEEIIDLLIKIKSIALDEEVYDIVKLVEDISDLLGDDFEIYKLGD